MGFGIHMIGLTGTAYCFDNEHAGAPGLHSTARICTIACDECAWFDFMADGGYRKPTLWLSDGWTAVETEQWVAPGYWRKDDGEWQSMTLGGLRPVDPTAPVTHVSYYEADAFAHWAGKHLPTKRNGRWPRGHFSRRCIRSSLAMDAECIFPLSRVSPPRVRLVNTTANS